jgi:hypothetical protein
MYVNVSIETPLSDFLPAAIVIEDLCRKPYRSSGCDLPPACVTFRLSPG